MNSNLKTKLQHLGFPSQSLEDYKDGVELSKLVATLPSLSVDLNSRIKKTNLHQTANRVININLVLKAIRDSSLCPQDIRKLTAFNVLEDEQSLVSLLSWLAQMHPARSTSEPQLQMATNDDNNALENLYFVSAIKHHYPEEENNAHEPNQEDIDLQKQQAIIPSGSKKILKPKIKPNLNDSLELKESEEVFTKIFEQQAEPASNLPRPYSNPPLPFNDLIKTKEKQNISSFKVTPVRKQSLQNNRSEDKKQSTQFQIITEPQSGRIKRSSPPSKWKQLPRQISQETASNHSSKRSNRFEKIEKDIGQIESSIQKQRKSLNSIKRSSFSMVSLKQKVQPINFIEVGIVERKQLVEWLISINLLNSLAIKNYDNLHLICKNGLIFPEIINYKKGRGTQLKYERNPRKPAEIHANYRRLFEYLKQFPAFSSELLFRYEYFVPQANQKAFWQLLCEIRNFYNNTNKHRRNNSIKIPQPAKQETIKCNESAKRENVYQDIKFGKTGFSSNKKSDPKKSTKKSSIHSESSDFEVREPIERQPQITQTSERKTIFTLQKQQTPKQQLNQQSIFVSSSSNSYQLIRTRKQQLCTPKRPESGTSSKNQNSHNSSINRSRVSLRNTPNSKQQFNLPVITLEMELIALKYLKDNNYKLPIKGNQHKDLFDDPLRNGTLLMLVVCRKFQCKADFYLKPKSIEDCRENHRIAFRIIKQNMSGFPKSLVNASEEIIKGQRSIFYGILFYLVNNINESPVQLDASSSNRNMLKTDCDRSCSFEEPSSLKQSLIQWLKTLLPQSRIKSFYQVQEGVKNGLLLTSIVSELTKNNLRPVHDNPEYTFQNEANITKALSVLNNSKRINSSFTWKVNKLAQGDESSIIGLLEQLRKMDAQKQKQQQQQQNPSKSNGFSFNQLLRNQFQNQNYNTLNTTFENPQPNYISKPLQTTMSNNGYSTNQIISAHQESIQQQQQPLQVDWMRKLGFTCDLSINSGVILCRIIEKLTMQTIQGVNYSPNNKGQMLGNIRKALRQLKKTPNGKLFEILDQVEVYNANNAKAKQVYALIREAYKHSYAFKTQTKKVTASNLHSL